MGRFDIGLLLIFKAILSVMVPFVVSLALLGIPRAPLATLNLIGEPQSWVMQVLYEFLSSTLLSRSYVSFLLSSVFLMASTRSFRAVRTSARRRACSKSPFTVRHLPITSRSASTYQPCPSLRHYTIGFVLGAGVGVGMGVGTCATWRKFASNVSTLDPDFRPELDVEQLKVFLEEPRNRVTLDHIGSSSKLQAVFDSDKISVRPETLLKQAPNTSAKRSVLFRIEDTTIKPGKPNVVGFLAIVEPYPNPSQDHLARIFGQVLRQRDQQREFVRPGMALLLVDCGGMMIFATYERYMEIDIESQYPDVIEDINE